MRRDRRREMPRPLALREGEQEYSEGTATYSATRLLQLLARAEGFMPLPDNDDPQYGAFRPAVLALSDDVMPMVRLIDAAVGCLPRRFHAHLTPGVEEGFREAVELVHRGRHLKMILGDPAQVAGADVSRARPVTPADLSRLLVLYDESYPGHWFEPEMLESGQYFGIWEGRRLVAAGGVHVYSSTYRVAALENIVTDRRCRSQGHGRCVTAAVCRSLLDSVDSVGLNVRADNAAALACYRGLGFEVAADASSWPSRRDCARWLRERASPHHKTSGTRTGHEAQVPFTLNRGR